MMLVFLVIFGGVFLMFGIIWKIIVFVFIIAVLVGVGIIYLVIIEIGRDLLFKIGIKVY